MTTENSLAVQGPSAMIHAAITGGADLEKLEKLMVLQERWEANEAKKAYVEAMAAFKANPPRIEKTKKVAYGTTSYSHALLADAAAIINAALSEHGLSAGWTTTQAEGQGITVTCTITHRLGHSESTALTAGPDTSGAKNSIQAIGSTVSYLSRYTLLSLTGLSSHDMDDDGRKADAKYITDDQCLVLEAMVSDNQLNANGKWLGEFLAYLKVESFRMIPAKDYNKAKAALQCIVAKRAKK